jgi:hypothetical protein
LQLEDLVGFVTLKAVNSGKLQRHALATLSKPEKATTACRL